MRPSGLGEVQVPARLWLLEGLPGAGKTSAARRLAEMCDDLRLPARWWPEEAKDHPATPSALRRRSADPDFADLCVLSFAELVHREDGVLILEGSAFQSTVRFMFANGWREPCLGAYLAKWASVVTAAQPRILLFRVDDVPGHFEQVVATRGQPWIGKLVAYVERTPIALANDWRGFQGFLRFWDAYQRLILDLAVEVKCPVLELQGWREGRGFAADDAFAFLNQ